MLKQIEEGQQPEVCKTSWFRASMRLGWQLAYAWLLIQLLVFAWALGDSDVIALLVSIGVTIGVIVQWRPWKKWPDKTRGLEDDCPVPGCDGSTLSCSSHPDPCSECGGDGCEDCDGSGWD